MPPKKKAVTKNGTSANLGFEQKLWSAADKMRGHMDAGEERKRVAVKVVDVFGNESTVVRDL